MTDSLQERLSSLSEDEDNVRVSAWRESEGWMDRKKVKKALEKQECFVETVNEPEKRYTFSTKYEKVATWNRYSMPVEGMTVNAEIVVELRDGDARWTESEELPVGSEILEHEPVGANHVAGLEDEKEVVLDFLRGIDRDFGLSEQTGIILQGPPGTGKTELVREICRERYGSVPVTISGPEILSKWVGESERALRSKFDEARNTRHRVLYIDELDAIGRSRDEASESYGAQVVAQLLVLLDGVESKKRAESTSADEDERSLKVIASTNKPGVVDKALRRPGRLGNNPIEFEKPDETERTAILHHYLEKVYVSEDGELGSELEKFVKKGETESLNELIVETDGFTGADIENWVIESVKRLRKEERDILDTKTLSGTLEEEFDEGEQEYLQPWS